MKMKKIIWNRSQDCVVIVWLTQSSSCSNDDGSGGRVEIAQLVTTKRENRTMLQRSKLRALLWQWTNFYAWLCGFYRATAMLSAVYAVVVCLCVCVSVCVSATLRYCIKTAKHRTTQTTPHDSRMTLVFWCQRSWRNSNGITPYGGDKCRWGGLKLVSFDEKRAITRKRYKIDV